MESTIIEIVQTLGIPTAIALGMSLLLYKLINRMMDNHEANLKKYQIQLDTSQLMATNHLSHVQTCLEKVTDKLIDHDERVEKSSDKIVISIEKQTDLMRDHFNKDQ